MANEAKRISSCFSISDKRRGARILRHPNKVLDDGDDDDGDDDETDCFAEGAEEIGRFLLPKSFHY